MHWCRLSWSVEIFFDALRKFARRSNDKKVKAVLDVPLGPLTVQILKILFCHVEHTYIHTYTHAKANLY